MILDGTAASSTHCPSNRREVLQVYIDIDT